MDLAKSNIDIDIKRHKGVGDSALREVSLKFHLIHFTYIYLTSNIHNMIKFFNTKTFYISSVKRDYGITQLKQSMIVSRT